MKRSRQAPPFKQVAVGLDAITASTESHITYIVPEDVYPAGTTVNSKAAPSNAPDALAAGTYFPPISLELAARANSAYGKNYPTAPAGAFLIWRVIGVHHNILELRWASLATTNRPNLLKYSTSTRADTEMNVAEPTTQELSELLNPAMLTDRPRESSTGIYPSMDGLKTTTSITQAPAIPSLDSLPPVCFVFPAPIVPNVTFYNDVQSNALVSVVVTRPGVFHRLNFPAPRFFHTTVGQTMLPRGTYSAAWKLQQALPNSSREISSVHSVDISNTIISLTDGVTIRLNQARSRHPVVQDGIASYYQAAPEEFELKRPGIIASSFRRFIGGRTPARGTPRAASKTADEISDPSQSSPSQTIAVASISGDILITLNRSRVLDIWSLDDSTWLDDIAVAEGLFDSENAPTDTPSRQSSTPLLGPSPRRLMCLWQSDSVPDSPLFLIVFQPHPGGDKFAAYRVNEDDSSLGQTTLEKEPSWVQDCERNINGGDLITFSIVPEKMIVPAPSGNEQSLWIASLWQYRNQTEIRYAKLSVPGVTHIEVVGDGDAETTLEQSMVIMDSEGNEIESTPTASEEHELQWSVIAAVEERPDEAHFDYILSTSKGDVQEVFVDYIFYPGRFSRTVLSRALQKYDATIAGKAMPIASHAGNFSLSDLRHRISTQVGSAVVPEKSPETGAIMFESFKKKIKTEWLKFVTFCHELKAQADRYHAVLFSPMRGILLFTQGHGISTLRLFDASEGLSDIAETLPVLTVASDGQLNLADTIPTQILTHFPSLDGVVSTALQVLRVTVAFTNLIPAEGMSQIQTRLSKIMRQPHNIALEDEAAAFVEEELAQYTDGTDIDELIDYLTTIPDLQTAIHNLLTVLTFVEMSSISPKAVMTHATSAFSNAALSQGVRDIISQRYKIVRNLLTLLFFMVSEEEQFIAHPVHTLDAALGVFRILDFLHWFTNESGQAGPGRTHAKQIEDSNASDDGAMASRMGSLHFSDNQNEAAMVPANHAQYNLLHALLQQQTLQRLIPTDERQSKFSEDAMAIDVQYPALSFLRGVGYIMNDIGLRPNLDVAYSLPLLASYLDDSGYAQVAGKAMDWIQPATAAAIFVRARSALTSGDADKAADLFNKAASGLIGSSVVSENSASLALVLPEEMFQGEGSVIGRYFDLVADLFLAAGVMKHVLTFGRKAISQFEREGTEGDLSCRKETAMSTFKAAVCLGQYDEAYTLLLTLNRYSYEQRQCLELLVTTMCSEDQARHLSRFAFIGLQRPLEEILSLRANASDPIASIASSSQTLKHTNYYHILYAHHTVRGDYRNAGSVMFQLGRRLGEVAARPTSNVAELALEVQAQSYLAAVNSLSLIDRKYAYVAVPTTRRSTGLAIKTKKRRVSFEIPDTFNSSGKDIEIVTLEDIKEEHAIVRARLELAKLYPELSTTAGGTTMEPNDVVSLLVRKSAFSQAADIAQRLKVDMSGLFEHLAVKCVRLSKMSTAALAQEDTKWLFIDENASVLEGPISDRAWKLLQKLLSKYDLTPAVYRQVVLEAVLNTDRRMRVPPWLTRYYTLHNPPALLRAYLRYDLLTDATKFAIQLIKEEYHTKDPLKPQTSSRWLPYTLIDQLLRALDDARYRPGALTDLQQLHSALETELDGYFGLVTGVMKQIKP